MNATAEASSVSVRWDSVGNADGYAVYKKLGDGAWSLMADTADTSCLDTDVKAEAGYSYTVVPYKTVEGEKMYGNFLYKGIYITAK